ncbi:MAG TPA: glycosyltransferase family 39 protein [Burkholderiaceae bacterium]|nr:glycosyltransferase family 39 protein [Burkholderiaceae bacterium]
MSVGNKSQVASGHAIASTSKQPITVLLLFLVGFWALWTLTTALSHTSPALDSLEELVWASSFELGYTKHPPFPTWLLYLLSLVFGKPVWLPTALGLFSSAVALGFIWLLGTEFTTPKRALIVTLLMSLSTYFATRATIYNHDTAQLWSIAASCWLFYRALRYEKWSSWFFLGLVSGVAFLTKYSAVIQFAAFFVFMVVNGHYLEPRVWRGVALAFLAFLVAISPHVYWLIQYDFLPFQYLDRSLESPGYFATLYGTLKFALSQLGRISPFVLAAILLIAWDRWRNNRTNLRYVDQLVRWDRSFLLWVGLAPFALTLLAAVLLGTRLSASWGTTFFILYGYFVLWWLSGSEALTLRRCLVLVVVLQIIMAVGYGLARGPLVHQSDRAARSSYPGPEIARLMQGVWQQHVPQQPLALVAAETWLGGNIAINLSPPAQVFIEGDWLQSPWLDQANALQCGVLVVYDSGTSRAPSAALQTLYKKAPVKGETALHWSTPESRLIELQWAIIPPDETCK